MIVFILLCALTVILLITPVKMLLYSISFKRFFYRGDMSVSNTSDFKHYKKNRRKV